MKASVQSDRKRRCEARLSVIPGLQFAPEDAERAASPLTYQFPGLGPPQTGFV